MKITTKAVALSAALAICAAPSGALIANSNHTCTIDHAVIPCFTTNEDPSYPQKKWAMDKILVGDAWNYVEGGNSSVKIGIIDNGIMGTHEDLATKVDRSLSQDFTGGNSPLTDSTGHGTAIAGIIGAEANNQKGIAGVCYNATLVSYKAETTAQVVSAIYYAKASGVNLLNISLDVTVTDDLKTAVQSYPGLIVCAAGNNNKNIDSDTTSLAALSYNNILTVGASTVADKIMNSSNYGKTAVDVFAPGEEVWTTNNDGGYEYQSGTSIAAPFVTGVAGLIMSNTDCSTAQLKQLILNNVDKISGLSDKCVSGGRLNAANSMHTRHSYYYLPRSTTYHVKKCSLCKYSVQESHKWVGKMDSVGNIQNVCLLCNAVKSGISSLSACGDDDCDMLDVILSTMDSESECLIHN